MSLEITGRIIAVLDKRTGVSNATGTAWSVQQYVIETHEQYPKKMCFDVFGGKSVLFKLGFAVFLAVVYGALLGIFFKFQCIVVADK